MARIYKRGKTWYIDVRVKGKRVRRRVDASKRIADLALKDAEVKIAKDEFGLARTDITLDRLIRNFLDYSRANHRQASTIRYGSVIDSFKGFIEKHTNITCISEITQEIIEKYKVYRRDSRINANGKPVETDGKINGNSRKGVKAHTINFELKTLNNIFNLAIQWSYLKDNPVNGVKRLKVDDTKRLEFLTKEECQRLLEACPPKLYPIYFTFLNTGMRKSELEHLEWKDVDFQRKKIRIRWKEFWRPKTGERDIPISPQLYDRLLKLKEENEAGLKSNFVFPHKDGGKIKTKLRERMIEIAKEAGIPELTRLHTLRHTFASHLVMQGVDLPTVMKLMGHSDIQTTMIYAHLAPDHLADAVEKLPFS